MPPFLHDRLQKLELLIQSSNDALRQFNDHRADLPTVAARLLDDASRTYHDFGLVDIENEMLALNAELTSAHAGVHPLTFERVTTHRRELERSIALRVLLRSGQRLRGDTGDTQRSLAATRERLAPLVLYALQKGYAPTGPDLDLSQPVLEHVWRCLLDDPESQAAARQAAMDASQADILILLADLLTTGNKF